MALDELVTMLLRLLQQPEDVDTRRRAAELLDQRGEAGEAMALLAPLVNYTGHEDASPLPCLCKTCIAGAGPRAETGGMGFHRSFAVAGTRVLHFWLADELAGERVEVRRAVGEALRGRVKRKRTRRAS